MWVLNLFFHFDFLIQDFSLNIGLTILKLDQAVYNIHLEGTLSQNVDIGPSFFIMSKNGKIFYYFFIIIFLDFIK